MEQRKCWLKSLELKFDEAIRRFHLIAVYRYYDNKGDLHEQTIPKIMLPTELNRRPDIEIIRPEEMLVSGYKIEFTTITLLAHYGRNTFELLPGELNGRAGMVFDKVISEGEG